MMIHEMIPRTADGLNHIGYATDYIISNTSNATWAYNNVIPDDVLTLTRNNTQARLTIKNDGTVEIHDMALDEASDLFWQQIGQDSPIKLKKELTELRAQLNELKDANKPGQLTLVEDPDASYNRAMQMFRRT